MTRWLAVVVSFLFVLSRPVVAQQATRFSNLGISRDTDLAALTRQYPHSQRVGDYIYVDPQDSHDHISGIAVSPQRVRISFETRVGGRLNYPPCAQIEKQVAKDFGPPRSIRRFYEEVVRHADRYWSSSAEELTLVCFVGPRGQLVAEAVVIAPR